MMLPRLIFSSLFRAIRMQPQVAVSPLAITRTLTQEHKDKQFVDQPTPYQRPKRKCILCTNNIELNYKNPRLLSQFVSPLNGTVYDKHITGLCERQQTLLQREIKKSRLSMLMPIYYRHPKYNKDPQLFNPDRPQRPNPH